MKILIPVDFSVVSYNAIQFAHELYPEADLRIIHSTSGTISTREPFYLKEGKTKNSVLSDELEKQILGAIGKDKLPPNVSYAVVIGETVASLKSDAIEYNPDLIIMGTRDNYDLVDKMFGTVSLRVTKSGLANTMLIPRYAKNEGIKKVIVATDHHMKDSGLLEWIIEWNKKHDAYISFIHVQDKHDDDINELSESIVQAILKEKKASFQFKIENVKNMNVADTLLSKAYNEGADMIIAAPDRQSLLNSLLLKSISKELIEKSKIPIMFLKH